MTTNDEIHFVILPTFIYLHCTDKGHSVRVTIIRMHEFRLSNLKPWNFGTLELWNSGTLELWNSETLLTTNFIEFHRLIF
jgi:hypothetical protein